MRRRARAAAIGRLASEAPNRAAANLDTLPALGIARVINREDKRVAAAVERALPQIAQAIDAIAAAIAGAGRLIYVGAGTSGRIAALDAAECPPTFNTSPRTVQAVIAGGARALRSAAEGREDSAALGRRDLARRKPTKKDVVVGIAASGRTPYTVAALAYARRCGAKTVALTNNSASPLQRAADIGIVVSVGPEVVAGSSRMKAGTAQKMVLNMLSTGAMARLGYVYGNLMVNVHRTNRKLRERSLSILERAARINRSKAERGLRAAGGSVPVALVMLKAGVTRAAAERRLWSARDNVRKAIEKG
ncbi:MAG: N-acetylmuramic acid 6-phosphate etherase [Acidobacteria bacterium]|nr:N-acetylmuramic acid 6-phosphate etherase [Acidobacteriota bacterium]